MEAARVYGEFEDLELVKKEGVGGCVMGKGGDGASSWVACLFCSDGVGGIMCGLCVFLSERLGLSDRRFCELEGNGILAIQGH